MAWVAPYTFRPEVGWHNILYTAHSRALPSFWPESIWRYQAEGLKVYGATQAEGLKVYGVTKPKAIRKVPPQNPLELDKVE